MSTEPKAPTRAYRLTLEMGADTAEDMVWSLRHFALRIEQGKIGGSGTWGSSTDGCNYELLTDPTMTHERFFADLHAYLDRDKTAAGPNQAAPPLSEEEIRAEAKAGLWLGNERDAFRAGVRFAERSGSKT